MISIVLHAIALNLKREGLDFERPYFLYRTKSKSKGISKNLFYTNYNILYTTYHEWFKKIQKKIIPEEAEGVLKELIPTSNKLQNAAKDKSQTYISLLK